MYTTALHQPVIVLFPALGLMVVRGQWSASRPPRLLAYKLDAEFVRHIDPTTVE